MLVKAKMVYLGAKQREYTKDGVQKKSTNVKLMDFESELYDFFVNEQNHNLLNDLGAVVPMAQVDVELEVGAYQLKPFVRLSRIKASK